MEKMTGLLRRERASDCHASLAICISRIRFLEGKLAIINLPGTFELAEREQLLSSGTSALIVPGRCGRDEASSVFDGKKMTEEQA